MRAAILLVMLTAVVATLSGDYPPSAQAATYTIGGTCADGYHKYPSGHPEYCPLSLTALSADATDTGVTITGTSSATGGTTYGSITLGSCGTPLHWQQIAAGAPDEASQSAAQSTTSISLAFTGLAELTAYCGQVVNINTAGFVSVIASVNFTTAETTPSESGTAITGGDDYFAGTGGSNGNSGTSHANRWATPPTTDSLAAGSDMWLYEGSIFNKQKMPISRQGSSGNWNEVGTYYMDGATPREWITGHTKAAFRGGLTDACIAARTCTFTNSDFTGDGLSGAYDTIITISSTADYTHVKNIRFEYTRAASVLVNGSGSAGSLTNVIVEGTDSQYTTFNHVTVANGSRDVVVRNNTWTDGGLCYGFAQYHSEPLCGAFWPGGFMAITSAGAKTLFEGNYATNSIGEGVGCFSSASFVVMRGNYVSNLRSGNIYVNGCRDVVIENNVSIGGDQSIGIFDGIWGNSHYGGIGVAKEVSNFYDNLRIYIRNNIVAGSGNTLNIYTSYVSTTWTVNWWGNTAIDGYAYQLIGGSTGVTLEAKNNLVWDQDLGAAYLCANIPSSATLSHNAFYNATPSAAKCQSGTNVYTAPQLATSTWSTWQGYANPHDTNTNRFAPVIAGAVPGSGSPLKAAGTALTSAVLTASDYGYGFSQIAEVLDATITQANWEKQMYYDFLNAARPATPTIGAIEAL